MKIAHADTNSLDHSQNICFVLGKQSEVYSSISDFLIFKSEK